jgi:hypothetical protein
MFADMRSLLLRRSAFPVPAPARGDVPKRSVICASS